MATYYFGWESLAEWGTEGDTAGTAYGTAVTPTEGFAWLRSATINADTHTEPVFNISGAKGRNWDQAYKERMETTASLDFWLPNNFATAACYDLWLLKLPVNAYNSSNGGSCYVIPHSAYVSNELLGITLEIGHNKAEHVRAHKLAGCVADRFTLRAREGRPVECSMDLIARTSLFNMSTFSSGVATRGTGKPLDWSNCYVYYADDGTLTTVTDITEFEFTIDNNLEPKYDLYGGSATQEFNRVVVGKQDITGSFTIDLSTTAGLEFYNAMCNDSVKNYANTNTVDEKECGIKICASNSDIASNVYFRFSKVFIPNIPMDIDPAAQQKVTIPWTANYMRLILNTPDTTNDPTNWDVQS